MNVATFLICINTRVILTRIYISTYNQFLSSIQEVRSQGNGKFYSNFKTTTQRKMSNAHETTMCMVFGRDPPESYHKRAERRGQKRKEESKISSSLSPVLFISPIYLSKHIYIYVYDI
jgi:5'-3' exonuclease